MYTHLKMNLCECHQKTPALDGSIFEYDIDQRHLSAFNKIAESKLRGANKLDLYATGLMSALVAVIKVCYRNKITLTIYYPDMNGQFYPQYVWNFDNKGEV